MSGEWRLCKMLERMADPGPKAFAARERHRTGIYAFEQLIPKAKRQSQ